MRMHVPPPPVWMVSMYVPMRGKEGVPALSHFPRYVWLVVPRAPRRCRRYLAIVMYVQHSPPPKLVDRYQSRHGRGGHENCGWAAETGARKYESNNNGLLGYMIRFWFYPTILTLHPPWHDEPMQQPSFPNEQFMSIISIQSSFFFFFFFFKKKNSLLSPPYATLDLLNLCESFSSVSKASEYNQVQLINCF